MRSVSVSTKDGLILVGGDDDGHVVSITPEQAPLLIEWIRDAAESLRVGTRQEARTDAERALHEFENPSSV
ncbi:MAG TPA: hypothetical protein VGL53_23910 [Bryobacteraceae bacterium]|jgi:hypothetical protein